MLFSKQGMAALLLLVISGLVMAKPTVDYCATCQSVSEFMHEMVQNQTESIMKTNLYKMCLKENDGANSRVCVFLASTMQNTLDQIGNEDFCTKINACPSGQPLSKPVTVNKERCEFCTNLLDSFKSLISDSSSDLLKESLNSYCALTGDFKDECKKNIDKNLANFVDFVQNKMDSETFCHAINSCHYQTLEEKKSPSVGDLLSLRDPLQIAGHLDMLEQEEKFNELSTIDAESDELGNPLSCIVCRQVVVIIYSQLHKNATRENVENLLAKSCKTIYFRNKEKERNCEEKVIKNAETILNGFINHIPPDLVCILTGMCLPGKTVQETANGLKQVPDLTQVPPKVNQASILDPLKKGVHLAQNYKCYFCEKIVQFLFRELDQAKTRKYIKQLLDESCSTLFKKEEREGKCEEYVNAYTDKLIDLIEKASNPGVICNSLHMCPVNFAMVTAWENKQLDRTIDSRAGLIETAKPKDGPAFVINWCKVCHRVYPVATEIVQIDAVREQITKVAHNFCDDHMLPINNCTLKADQYIEVIATVRDQEDGCKKLTLCPAPNQKIEVDEISLNLQVFDLASIDTSQLSGSDKNVEKDGFFEDIKCSACKILVKGLYADLDKTVHSPSTKRLIEQTCDHIHQDDLKEKCKQDALAALEELVKDLTRNFPPETACELMTYCKKKANFDYRAALKPLAEKGICNACKTLFPVLHRILQDEQVRARAKNILTQYCNHATEPERCTQFFTELIDNLADEETPAGGCSSLCKQTAFTAALFNQASGCTVCQTSMVIVDEIFRNENVKNRLNHSLESFCETHADKNQENCKHIVRQNLPKLYEMVENITDHDHGFCPTFGFCNGTKHAPTLSISIGLTENDDSLLKGAEDLLPSEDELLSEPFLIANHAGQGAICDNCKSIFGQLQKIVREHKDAKDELLKHLIATCPKQDDKCREFYKKYINYFYSQLLRNTDPDRVCPLLRLCPQDFTLMFPDAESNDEDWKPALELTETTVCKECQSAIEYLVNTLNNKTVVDFILKEVQQNVCQPLSFFERKACNRLVKQFGPKIVAHFAQRINEDNICAKHLRLCKKEEMSNHISIDKNDDMDFELINFVEDPNCVVCTRSVDRLNAIRGDSSRKYSIEEICGKDDPECSEFMLNFQDFFLTDEHNRDSILACTELNICLIPGKVQLLGGDKCRYGPAYSCLTSAHAEACKTTKFCEQNYWKAVSN